MTRPVRDHQRVISRGEIDPLAHERDDVDLWRSALKESVCMLPLIEGANTQTPGSCFVAEAKNPAEPPALFDFVFSNDPAQSYAIEGGNLYFRFHQRVGTVMDGGAPYEVTTPYAYADLADLHWVQSADNIYFAHGGYAPKVLKRFGQTDWRLEDYAFTDGPYDVQNLDESKNITLSSGTKGAITLSADFDAWTADHVGMWMRFFRGGEWAFGKITAYNNAQSVALDLQRTLPGSGSTFEWRMGAWGNAVGWPDSVSFVDERLCWGKDFYVDHSVSGEFERFSPTTEIEGGSDDGKITNELKATDAFRVALQGNQVNKVQFLMEDDNLVCGTLGAIRTISVGNSSDPALSPENAKQGFQNKAAASRVRPIQTNEGLIVYVHQHLRRILALAYNLDTDKILPDDLTQLSRHLTRGGCVELVYQAEPHQVIWFRNADGGLRSITLNIKERVRGGARHTIAGTAGECCSLTTIPGEGQDELWMVTRRIINGQQACFIERQAAFFEPDSNTDRRNAVFTQASVEYSGAPVSVIDVPHLEGETVQLFADGADQGDFTVTGGQIIPKSPVSEYCCGLGYDAYVRTLGIPSGLVRDNAANSRETRAMEVGVSVYHSLGFEVGQEGRAMEKILTQDSEADLTQAEPWVTDVLSVSVDGDFAGRGSVEVRQKRPLPCTIRSIQPLYDSQRSG